MKLENAAQVTSIPGVDLGILSPARRLEAVQEHFASLHGAMLDQAYTQKLCADDYSP